MVKKLTTGFCSVVCRKKTKFPGNKRDAIFKRARNPLELSLLRNEIVFYSKLLQIYNAVQKLHFTSKKLYQTFFKGSKEELFIEDLKNYKTKSHLSFSNACIILEKLALFHCIGFLLKKILQHQKSSQKIGGS